MKNKCECSNCMDLLLKQNIFKKLINRFKPVKKQKYECHCIVCCSKIEINLNDVKEISQERISIRYLNNKRQYRDTIAM
jgi:hypothetical protein